MGKPPGHTDRRNRAGKDLIGHMLFSKHIGTKYFRLRHRAQLVVILFQEIVEGLRQLHGALRALTEAGAEQLEAHLANVRREVDGLSALLRRREDVITF